MLDVHAFCARLASRWKDWKGLALQVATSVILVALVAYPFFADSQFRLRQFTQIFIFAIATLGLMLPLGYVGLLNFSQGTFYGVGAYTTAILMKRFSIAFAPATAGGAILAGALGFLLTVTTHRAKRDFFGLISMAFTIAAVVIMRHWTAVTESPEGYSGVPLATLFGRRLDTATEYYYVTLTALVITYISVNLLVSSFAGRAMLATRFDEVAARSTGISTQYFKYLAMTIGSALGGIAGGMSIMVLLIAAPNSFDLLPSFQFTILVIVGGLASPRGVLFATAVLTFLTTEFAVLYDLSSLLLGSLLILFIFLRSGILREMWHTGRRYPGHLMKRLRRDKSILEIGA